MHWKNSTWNAKKNPSEFNLFFFIYCKRKIWTSYLGMLLFFLYYLLENFKSNIRKPWQVIKSVINKNKTNNKIPTQLLINNDIVTDKKVMLSHSMNNLSILGKMCARIFRFVTCPHCHISWLMWIILIMKSIVTEGYKLMEFEFCVLNNQ